MGVFHQCHVVYHKLKSRTTSMPMVFLMSLPLRNQLAKNKKLLLLTIKDVYPKKKLNVWSPKPKNTKQKTKPMPNVFKPKILENYCYSMKNAMNDEKLQGKIDDADKTTVNDKVAETLAWLESHQESETEEYEEKKKETEGICSPIIQKVYAAAGGAPGGAGGM